MQDYYLGLDVGTNSVGWAVTDPQYNLIKAPVKGKYKNHDMWGIRLFDGAETAETRRINRSLRRRIQRRKDRIKLLQDIFKDEIEKVDSTFFIRLNESRLQKEDKSTGVSHPLFNDNNYKDDDYYKEFPTIFHLRKELMNNPNPHDIRMVYLALHNIIKYRGNFLIKGEVSSEEQKDINIVINRVSNAFDNYGFNFICLDSVKVTGIILDKKLSKSEKARRIKEFFELSKKNEVDNSQIQHAVTELCKIFVGNKGDLSKIFTGLMGEEIEDDMKNNIKVKFSDGKWEESQRDELELYYPEEVEVMDTVKAFYDWSIFVGIMGKYSYISDAKIDAYNKHKEELAKLKRLMKKYCSDSVYREFFHSKKDESKTYSAYVGMSGKFKSPIKKCSEDDFYKELKNILDSIEKSIKKTDLSDFNELKMGTENHDLLPTLRNRDNGSIPRQIHEQELKKILNNAINYCPFLNDEDDKYNKTNYEKIISIFEHKIPYYVGPLGSYNQIDEGKRKIGSNAWMQRKRGMEKEKIYPWNFEDVVDEKASNEKFIMRMTNKCTYLTGEDVLPKNSILYQRFMVLNELNNLRIRGEKIDVALKQEIYSNLFEKKKRVTGKQLINYLNNNYGEELSESDISGIDKDFNSNLASTILFQEKVFKCTGMNDNQKTIAEDVIRWKTIYGDDIEMTLNVIKEKYPKLSEDILKGIRRLPKFSNWGNFSRKFLTGIFCEEMIDKSTGEMSSIIDAMWNTNENLMQLLSNRFGYQKRIKEVNSDIEDEITSVTYKNCVEGLCTSPENKRAIWQTLMIAEEIKKIMKCEPKKIFIEMARGGGKKGKRTKSRREQLIELYKNCEKDSHEWNQHIIDDVKEIESKLLSEDDERKYNSKKLYLYYLQNGKCAYSGEPIDLDKLMNGNSDWDIDHIFPQSKIDDDSFDNLVLVKKKINAKKNNDLLDSNIQKKMHGTWKYWVENGFISRIKYGRLTKSSDFTDEELSGFISRQIVETRQSTKLISDVLDKMYSETKVVYVKAKLVSQFRQYPLNVKKSRLINDYHHAKDAYLNIVVGNVYNNKYTDNPYKWIKDNRDTNYSITRTMFYDVKDRNGENVWNGCGKTEYLDDMGKTRYRYNTNENNEITGGDIDRIRLIARRNNCMYTECTYCDKGQLFDASHMRKGDESSKIPLKKTLEMEKYGGYKSANTSYFALIEFEGKNGERVKNIVGVPIYIDNILEHNKNAFIEYCESTLEKKNVKVLKEKIKKNALIIVDGFPMRLRGENDNNIQLKSNLQLKLGLEYEEVVRLIECFFRKKEKNKNLEIDQEYDKLNNELLLLTYDQLTDKLKTIYKSRPANQYNKLVELRDKYIELSLSDKAEIIKQIIQMLRCDNECKANLGLIGASTGVGNIAVNKNTLGKSNILLVNQSTTGLFENREMI